MEIVPVQIQALYIEEFQSDSDPFLWSSEILERHNRLPWFLFEGMLFEDLHTELLVWIFFWSVHAIVSLEG